MTIVLLVHAYWGFSHNHDHIKAQLAAAFVNMADFQWWVSMVIPACSAITVTEPLSGTLNCEVPSLHTHKENICDKSLRKGSIPPKYGQK